MNGEKVRMTRREYAAGMVKAKALGMTFAKWSGIITERYLKRCVEGEAMEAGKLSRKDSVSVYVGCKGVSGAVVRMAVADAVVQEEDVLWRYRWRKDVLDNVIYAQGFFGNVIGYDEAEKIMDSRLEERKIELTTSTYAKATADMKNTKSTKKERKA